MCNLLPHWFRDFIFWGARIRGMPQKDVWIDQLCYEDSLPTGMNLQSDPTYLKHNSIR